MVGISHAYDEEAAALEARVRRLTFKLFDIHILRSIDRLPEGDEWDDSRFLVRTRRGLLGETIIVSRLMVKSTRLDAARLVASEIADACMAYDRLHA